jgi:hypothetical protein
VKPSDASLLVCRIPWDVETSFAQDNGLGGAPGPYYCVLACEQWNSPLYCDSEHPQVILLLLSLLLSLLHSVDKCRCSVCWPDSSQTMHLHRPPPLQCAGGSCIVTQLLCTRRAWCNQDVCAVGYDRHTTGSWRTRRVAATGISSCIADEHDCCGVCARACPDCSLRLLVLNFAGYRWYPDAMGHYHCSRHEHIPGFCSARSQEALAGQWYCQRYWGPHTCRG